MYCADCGKEIPDTSEFCGYCGAATSAPAVGGGQPPPGASTPPGPPAHPGGAAPPAAPAASPAQYATRPPGKSPLPWILGMVGLLAVVAVVLVLVFVVFKGDEGKTTDASGPERVVESFFKSLERQDAKMLVGTMEPDFVAQLESILGQDYLQLFDEYFFEVFPEDLKVSIRKMDTSMRGDDRAEVTVLEGTMTWTEDGERFTEEAADVDMGAFELVRVDGEWYLSEDTLIDWGFDFSGYADLGDLDMDDGFFDDDRFGDAQLLIASEDDAMYAAFSYELWGGDYPTINDWYWATNSATYDIVEEDTRYLIYFYEFGYDGTDIPFGWFAVEKDTGDVYEVTNY